MTEQEFALRAQDQRSRLYRTAFLYLGGEHAAVDAVDEAVYRAFRDRRKLRQPEFFETWLTRILINVCKDELRRRRRECRVCVPPLRRQRTPSLQVISNSGSKPRKDQRPQPSLSAADSSRKQWLSWARRMRRAWMGVRKSLSSSRATGISR